MGAYEEIVVLNYRLTRKLGEGGFGAVYLAVHETLGRKAAVKILHAEYARNKALVDRFFGEAKAVCAIGHRSIIDIQNYGYLETGEPYYLMEYVAGRDLGARIQADGPLAISELEEVFAPVVSALEAAHSARIIHRDLKPENIMLVEDEGRVTRVTLLDFGIAKLVDHSAAPESKTGVAMGTPQFMAPEQARDAKNVDIRADVYAFGATVFTALCGRPPFVASNITDLILQVHTQEAPRLRELLPSLPQHIDDAIAQCLEKTSDGRPASIREAWDRIRGGAEAGLASAGGASSASAPPESLRQPAALPEETVLRTPMPRWPFYLVGGAALLAAVAFLAFGGGEESAGVASASKEALDAGAIREPLEPAPSVDAAPQPAPPRDRRCSIYDYLQLDNGINTADAAEAKLAEFERCLAEGKIRHDQFAGLRESLIRQIGAFRREEREAMKQTTPVPYAITFRGAQGETVTGTIRISHGGGKIRGGGSLFTKVKRLAGESTGVRCVVHTDSDGNRNASYARARRIADAFSQEMKAIGLLEVEGKPVANPMGMVAGPENRRVECTFSARSGQ